MKSKLLNCIIWSLIIISINTIALIFFKYSLRSVIAIIVVVFISQILTVLGFIYILEGLSANGGISDWLKFIRELKLLKDTNIRNSLSELTKLPKVVEVISKSLIPESKILLFNDYLNFLKSENIDEVWVLGASLNSTLNNLDDFLNRLKKGILFQFLCVGDRVYIESRVRKIVTFLKEKNPTNEYFENLIKNVKLNIIESHLVQLPMEILNPHKNYSKAIIRYPYELKQAEGKEHVFLITNQDVVSGFTEKFSKLWDSYKSSEFKLGSFIN